MKQLIDILYEPIFGVMLLGIVAFFIIFKTPRTTKIVKTILYVLVAMIAWRFVFAQVSTRYWAAVLFPALLFLGYVCYLPNIGIRISRVVLIIILLACLGKDFHLNWNNKSIINAAEAIKTDATQYKHSLITELEDTGLLTRMGYYSGIPTLMNVSDNEIFNGYKSMYGMYNVLYIIGENDLKKHHDFLKKLTSWGVKVLFAQEKDMRKNKKIYVYKLEIPSQEKLLIKPIKLVENGDFELITQNKNKDGSQYIFPKFWGRVSHYKLEDKNPISGKYSLNVKSNKFAVLFSSVIKNSILDGLIVFDIKEAKFSNIQVVCWAYDENRKLLFKKVLLNTRIPSNQLYQLQIPWHADIFKSAHTLRFYWYITAPNGLIMDNVEFVPQN